MSAISEIVRLMRKTGSDRRKVKVTRLTRKRPRRALKVLRTRPNRRMKMANAPALIGLRDQHGEARWRLDDVSILGLRERIHTGKQDRILRDDDGRILVNRDGAWHELPQRLKILVDLVGLRRQYRADST